MKLILGHNQFIGVSHISETRSDQEYRHFSTPERIMDLVEVAYEIGIRSMVVETHPRMLEFLHHYSKVATVDMDFILQVPNVQSYVRQLGAEGLEGIMVGVLREASPILLVKSVLRSAKDVVQNKYANIGATGLDLIASQYLNYGIERITIHNVITDFMLGLDMADVLLKTKQRMEMDHDVKVGFITLNLPLFETALEGQLVDVEVMTPLNPWGYDMNPSKEAVEESVKRSKNRIIGINVLGGGAIPIRDAVDYIKGLGVVQECVIGSSNPVHIQELFDLLVSEDKQTTAPGM